MKPPRWMELQPPYKGTLSEDGKSVRFTFRIKWWHPGLWIAVIKARLGR